MCSIKFLLLSIKRNNTILCVQFEKKTIKRNKKKQLNGYNLIKCIFFDWNERSSETRGKCRLLNGSDILAGFGLSIRGKVQRRSRAVHLNCMAFFIPRLLISISERRADCATEKRGAHKISTWRASESNFVTLLTPRDLYFWNFSFDGNKIPRVQNDKSARSLMVKENQMKYLSWRNLITLIRGN